jgi:hypothetical protein
MTLQIVYVLTTDGNDSHADLNLVSAMSARIHNPAAKIVLVCDEESAAALKQSSHRICSIVDSIVSVSTPDGAAGFRNRFVKTRMRQAVEGPFLYLDADTVVRGSLGAAVFNDCDMASAPNHSGSGTPHEIPGGELATFSQLNWDTPSRWYVNGGVHFFQDNARVHRFFDEWHKRWQQCSSSTGKHFDQPALNSALNSCDLRFQWLPEGWNAQIHARPFTAANATIWHFYTSDHHASPRTHVDRLLARMHSGGTITLDDVRKISLCKHPWVARGPISAIAVRRLLQQQSMLQPLQWERLWLAGQSNEVLASLLRGAIEAGREALLSLWTVFRRRAGKLRRKIFGT